MLTWTLLWGHSRYWSILKGSTHHLHKQLQDSSWTTRQPSIWLFVWTSPRDYTTTSRPSHLDRQGLQGQEAFNLDEDSSHLLSPMATDTLPRLENHHANKYEQPYKDPYLVMQINTNGTVHLKIGAVTDTMNIRCIHPLKTMSSNANHGGECSMCHSIAQVQCTSW